MRDLSTGPAISNSKKKKKKEKILEIWKGETGLEQSVQCSLKVVLRRSSSSNSKGNYLKRSQFRTNLTGEDWRCGQKHKDVLALCFCGELF